MLRVLVMMQLSMILIGHKVYFHEKETHHTTLRPELKYDLSRAGSVGCWGILQTYHTPHLIFKDK